jgi:hypothetical protein
VPEAKVLAMFDGLTEISGSPLPAKTYGCFEGGEFLLSSGYAKTEIDNASKANDRDKNPESFFVFIIKYF